LAVLTGGRMPGRRTEAYCLAVAATLALFIDHATAQGFFESNFTPIDKSRLAAERLGSVAVVGQN
jgi:hypothetical protein